ncbi:MAG: phosphatase PAP2 family protein [Actinomycetota bacterium]
MTASELAGAGSSTSRQPLDQVDDRATDEAADPGPLRHGGRRRRPTGEPPPLPPEQWWAGARWALVAVLVVVASLLSFVYIEPDWVLRVDEVVGRWLVVQRTDTAVTWARVFDGLTDPLLVGALRWGTIAMLLVVRRLRHLAVFVAALLLVEWAAQAMNFAIQRPRPMVDIAAEWDGFSHPSRPMAALTVTLLGSLRVLAPHGPIRRYGAAVVGGVAVVVGLSRVVLGVDHPSDVVVACAIAAGVVFALTRLVVPHSRFPVEYRRGEHAHVSLSDRRVEAIGQAVVDQLGLTVREVALHGEDGSAGSTPLRIEVDATDGPQTLFAKLYTRQHLRSDRLYKLARLLMYGRLENETPFASVRQLVQYEDHLTRVMRDSGVTVPDSHGIVEITPEQEYLIVFAFVDGHDFDIQEDVSDELLDGCLSLVDQLWTAGIAHRDIKPGNLLVHGDHATLIDVAFAQLRPTPWRQAVDLGAMLLLLSLAADPDRVYRRALRLFEPEEIAEALAATDGFAIPSQLRGLLEDDGWAVRDRLRALAPEREAIRIHRWDRRRIAAAMLTLAVLLAAVLGVWVAFDTVGLL